jgi:hypothetical protein
VRRRIEANGGVRQALIDRLRPIVAQWEEATGLPGPRERLASLEAGRAVRLRGWEVSTEVPGRGLAHVPWVRLEEDDTITILGVDE